MLPIELLVTRISSSVFCSEMAGCCCYYSSRPWGACDRGVVGAPPGPPGDPGQAGGSTQGIQQDADKGNTGGPAVRSTQGIQQDADKGNIGGPAGGST